MNHPFENLTSVTAGAAMTSPWWLPALHGFSQIAAEAAPILGALWLLVQIGSKLHEMYKRHKTKDDV